MKNSADPWERKGAFDYNSIRGDVFSCSSEDCIINDSYDVGIFFSSFESRSLFSNNHFLDKLLSHSVIVYFSEAINSDLRRKNDPILLNQVKKCTRNEPIIVKDVSIKKLRDTLLRILKSVPGYAFEPDSKWFIDIGGAPTPYFLGLIGFLKSLSLPPKVTLFNPTAKYPIKNDQINRFTSGFERNVFIPYFWGSRNNTLARKFIIMLGFDEYRNFKICSQQEPDDIEVFISSPGYEPEYEETALDRNKNFLEEYGVSSSKIHRSCAANISETITKLKQIITRSQSSYNVYLVPLGVKAHALSCGLCSLAEISPTVVYNMPRTYEIKDVIEGRTVWKYNITL